MSAKKTKKSGEKAYLENFDKYYKSDKDKNKKKPVKPSDIKEQLRQKKNSIEGRKNRLERLGAVLGCVAVFFIYVGFRVSDVFAVLSAVFGSMYFGTLLHIRYKKLDEEELDESIETKVAKAFQEVEDKEKEAENEPDPDPVEAFKNQAKEYCQKITAFTKSSKNKKLNEIISLSLNKINRTLNELDENEIRQGELSKLNSKYLSNYTSLLDSYKRIYGLEDMGDEYKETLSELEEAIIQYDTAFDSLYKKAVESDVLAAGIDASVSKKMLAASGLMGSDFKIDNN